MFSNNNHNKIVKALEQIRPEAKWSLKGETYNGLEWFDTNQTKPTEAEIKNAIDNPTPQAEPTVEQKLASVGLNLDDLKQALGL